MYVERCLFVDGIHVAGPDNCPHTWKADELGAIMETGWTAQQDIQPQVSADERQDSGK